MLILTDWHKHILLLEDINLLGPPFNTLVAVVDLVFIESILRINPTVEFLLQILRLLLQFCEELRVKEV